MEKSLELDKEIERSKIKQKRRRTFHGSTQQLKTPKGSRLSGVKELAGILPKTPGNLSGSVRKPLQVVSASKAALDFSSFSSSCTRKAKSRSSASKTFTTKIIEPVVKSKNPLEFTTPKTPGLSLSNLSHEKLDSNEEGSADFASLGCQSSASSSDEFRNNSNDSEKPFVLQKLVTSRKSRKLDFIVKESKASKTDNAAITSWCKKSKPSLPQQPSSDISKTPASSITKEPSQSSIITNYMPSASLSLSSKCTINGLSTSITKTNASPPPLTFMVPSSSSTTVVIESTTSVSSVSSCVITDSTAAHGMTSNENICQNNDKNGDLPTVTGTRDDDTALKLAGMNQKVLNAEENEPDIDNDEFSNNVISATPLKRCSKAIHKCLTTDQSNSGDNQNTAEEKLTLFSDRKKLKVSRRSVTSNSSRKALQEARLQALKQEFKNNVQVDRINNNLSLTSGVPEINGKTLSIVSEAAETSTSQRSTPSPDVAKSCTLNSETQSLFLSSSSLLSSSTNSSSSQGLESSTKNYKDWMHLFEEPFPRRSPRLSSVSTNAANDYEYLLDNFSPLTSWRRSKGRKKKQVNGSERKNTTTSEDTPKNPTVSEEPEIVRKLPVSQLVVAEKEVSQTSTHKNEAEKREESLKRSKTKKGDKNILSKKKKPSLDSLNQAGECSSPGTGDRDAGFLDEKEIHFPKPTAVLSCSGGPYSMIVDFALPDKDFAKLKLAKIKKNQAKKTASKHYDEGKTSRDLKKKAEVRKKDVINSNKNNEGIQVDEDNVCEKNKDVSTISMTEHSMANYEETGSKDEGASDVIPSKKVANLNGNEILNKDDELCGGVQDKKSFFPVPSKLNTESYSATDKKCLDSLSEETYDSENTPSGSILQGLQAPNSSENHKNLPEKSLKEIDSTSAVENKEIHISAYLGRSLNSEKKNVPEMLETSSCLPASSNNCHSLKEQSVPTQHEQNDLIKLSHSNEKNPVSEDSVNSEKNEMKGNKKGKKFEFTTGKECVPSSQGSSANSSQSPNVLKGLLSLNGPVSSHVTSLSSQKQQQENACLERSLINAEKCNISKGNCHTITMSQSKDLMDDVKDEEVNLSPNSAPVKQKSPEKVVESLEMTEVYREEEKVPLNQELIVRDINQLNEVQLNSKDARLLKLKTESDISAVNHPPDNQPILDNTTLSLFQLEGDIKMGFPAKQICDDQSLLNKTSLNLLQDSIVKQETTDSESVDKQKSIPFFSNMEEFVNDTPTSKGSFPLYSNPEECNEHTPDLDGSFPLCTNTEEFDNVINTAEAESLEPSIGDTATPYGKACVPKGCSVPDMPSDQQENSVLTPVLMQACLQMKATVNTPRLQRISHENSDSSEVLSISMSTYGIPGHITKNRDVIAVCLSHWVVLWIKVPGQEWSVLKSWTLDNTDSEMFQLVKVLPVTLHLVLFVGGTFPSANSRIYGYSETTTYDFQLEHKDVDEMMLFNSMCILNDKEQCTNLPDSDVELVVAGATANGPIVTKWTLDCLCLDVKNHQELALSDEREAVNSLCTVAGSTCLLIGSTRNHLLLWNFKSCSLLKEISLNSVPGLNSYNCLQATTEMGLLFLTMCQSPATDKDKFGSASSFYFHYALNPVNNNFKCISSLSLQELPTRCSCVSGQYLAVGQQDGIACLLNMAAPHNWVSFPAFQGTIESASFHPYRPIVAFGSGKNGCVHLYSLS